MTGFSPVLNAALGYEQQLPARRAKDIEALLEVCPELEFMIDGTERPVRRPKDGEQQQAKYSASHGEKQRHHGQANGQNQRTERDGRWANA